jgi:concanavalin A-like lectin/glucanase superfamily protein
VSFDFRGIRVQSNDPMLQFLVEQQKKLAKFLTDNQLESTDSDNEDIYSDAQDMETAVKYHSELGGQHKFLFIKDYYPPFEPDFNQVKCWIRGTNLGNTIEDISGFNSHATLYGDPTLVDGTIDLGYQTHGVKSIALRLNRPTSDFENEEWLQIPDTTGLQLASATTGFSAFFRIRMQSLAQQGGRDATIIEKIDDSTPNNGILLKVEPDGTLDFIVKDGGVTTAKETAAGAIVAGTVYDIFVTYATSGPTIHIYINGVDQTLSNFAGSVNWHETLTNHDVFIGRRGLGNTEGFAYMDFYDFKPYYNRIVNQTEVTQHQTNKWTIANIGFGHVMIVDHYATYTGSGGEESVFDKSFTSGSYTTTSFEV